MKRFMQIMLILLISLSLITPVFADGHMPGKGTTVKPGRASWSTGYFTEAIASQLLEELGYKVKKPKELANPIFYQTLALGDLDYWVNDWFPMHNAQLPKTGKENVTTLGYVMKAGGLQGYLISKKYAEQFNIKSLDDFKRPEVMKAFDANGDGKADLTACPPGWGCEKVIAHHMDAYNLSDSINLIKASYSASVGEALARHQNGKPIFFYTWAPNWTIHKMKPGKDVVWINVPETKPTDAQKTAVDRMEVEGIEGAVSSPVKLGFVVADVQVVANKKFLAKNPAAGKLLELFTVPLSDVNAQNTKMQAGFLARNFLLATT